MYQRWARLWSRDWDWDQSGLKAGLKLWDHLPKVSVSVSKFETDFKSISISLKFWDHNAKVSVSVSKCNGWSRSSQILRPSEKVNFTSTFHKFLSSGSYEVIVSSSKLKVSVSVSMFETDDGLSLSLNFWDQRQKSQYQSQFLRPIL